MVGDGLNDAPALAAAHVSASPVSAVDLTQAQADAIFLDDRLWPIMGMLVITRHARRLMLQNLSLAAIYNAVAVPIAVAGLVTPLIAAVAMSSSSLNALRARAFIKVRGAIFGAMGATHMNVLVYLVPMALALGLAGLAAFLWSLKADQYD